MKKWVWINIILKALDLGTTCYCVNVNGLQVEKNPLVRCLFEHVGLNMSVFIVFTTFALMMWVLYLRNASIMLKIVTGLMTLAVINNFIQILRGVI